MLPLQVEPDGTATFILSELRAGTTKRFRLEDGKSMPASMLLIRDHDRLTITASGRKVLTFHVYNAGQSARPYAMFDLVSTQNLATSSPLVLPEYRYEGIGFRGHRQWLEKDNCDFLTSEGKDRSNGHGTRARWCHIGGRIDGQLAGIAILDHPDNFRAPQAMRINPEITMVGTAYTYLQDFLPHVAQAAVRGEWADSIGLGRMVLAYPELPIQILKGGALDRKRLCRTFSDCTTAPRNGLPSGCYPLDGHYKNSEMAAQLSEIKNRYRKESAKA